MAFDDIPVDIRSHAQWINWEFRTADDGKQTKVPVRPIDGKLASVNNPLDWTTFERAKEIAIKRNVGLGFVFTKSDPFTGIDLDHANGDAEVSSRQSEIYQRLNSYTEQSPSGNGLHIIVKAELPGNGRRKNKIECYDNQRFFTFTGNIFYNAPVAERQSETLDVWNSLGSAEIVTTTAGYEAEIYSDTEILEHAGAAINGDKFKRLWSGDWQTDYGDKSQSEADFALINIIAFYSRNLTQTVRVFRQSILGSRQKSQRGKYVMTMAQRSFDRMPPQISIPDGSGLNGHAWHFDATQIEPWPNRVPAAAVVPAVWLPSPTVAPSYKMPAAPAVAMSYAADDPGRPLDFADPIPPIAIPGMVGELVQQCWNSSVHQVAEVSIASALSTMSLLCSRSYRHGTLGLPLYIMLLAQTSTGKSFAYAANDAWFNKLLNHYRSMAGAERRLGDDRAKLLENMIMGEMGSAQGLAQQIAEAPSTLFHGDEYVDTIRMMASPNPPPHLAQIRAELLRLMEMSGPGRVYRARKYSKRGGADNAEDVISASLTILATGTPQQFYDELTPTLLTTGFLPRFTMLEYEGGLTPKNPNVMRDIEPNLFRRIIALFDLAYNKSITVTGNLDEFIDVQPANQAAHDAMEWFDNYCARKAQSSNDVGNNMAGIWSRAKEHVRQVASLIAIGVNPHVPTILPEYVDIAMRIVRPTIDKVERMVGSGETGTGDQRLEAEIVKFVKKLIAGGWGKYKTYKGCKRELIDNGYFQVYLIRNYCLHLQSFKSHRLGASAAFESTLNGLIKYGTFKQMDCNGHKCIMPHLGFFE